MSIRRSSLLPLFWDVILFLFPRSFRNEFGYEMKCDFADATNRAWNRSGRFKVLALWVWFAGDLALNLIIQWFQTGVPTLIGISATSTILLFALLALQGIPQNNALFIELHLAWLVLAVVLVLLSILSARYHAGRAA
jgi:hypothetical protein